jgi:hypothetical protein
MSSEINDSGPSKIVTVSFIVPEAKFESSIGGVSMSTDAVAKASLGSFWLVCDDDKVWQPDNSKRQERKA